MDVLKSMDEIESALYDFDLHYQTHQNEIENVRKELNYAKNCHELEEERGCPLDVIFKALGHFIYDEDGNAWYIEHYYQEYGVYQLHSVRHCGRSVDKKFNTKDYKKTWWLRKDKSE